MTVALRNKKGFGLIESLITMAVLIIVLGSVYSLLAFNQKTASVQDQVLGLNQTIIAATELIGREARQAGLKVAVGSGTKYYCENITNGTNSGWTTNIYWDCTGLTPNTNYSFRVKEMDPDGIETNWKNLPDQNTLTQTSIRANWTPNAQLGLVARMIPSVFLPASPAPVTVTLNSADYPIKITQGTGTSPDAVTIIGAIGDKTYPTQLTTDSAPGDTTINLKLTATETQARYAVGDAIYIGEVAENAKITDINGNQLVIDTDPGLAGNQGLTRTHAQWTEVGKISVISYEIFNVNGTKKLMRKENGGNFEAVAEDTVVADLQATQNGNRPTIDSLTVQTAKPDINYTPNGGYRQKTFTIQLAPMNM